jgi:hypothetical protein
MMDKAVENGDLPYPIFPGGLIYQVPGTPDECADVTFNVAHSYYNHNLDAEDLSRQIVEQHRQNCGSWRFIASMCPFENCRLTGLGSLPASGIRGASSASIS